MPRTYQKKQNYIAATTDIQARISLAARSFAQELLHILGASTLSELTVMAGRALPDNDQAGQSGQLEQAGSSGQAGPSNQTGSQIGRIQGLTPASGHRNSRTIELKRLGGTRPVECPVPDCDRPGVRAKMNFCHEHATALPRAEKLRLREAQRAASRSQLQGMPQGSGSGSGNYDQAAAPM